MDGGREVKLRLPSRFNLRGAQGRLKTARGDVPGGCVSFMVDGGRGGQEEKRNHQAHQAHQEVGDDIDRLARIVVDAGFKVHKTLGPGLLESVYEHCLVYELELRGLSLRRQAALPIRYGEVFLDAGYRLDLIVEDAIIVEIKTVENLTRLHEAQLMTYLRCSGCRIGFLMNFNAVLFKHGVRRLVL